MGKITFKSILLALTTVLVIGLALGLNSCLDFSKDSIGSDGIGSSKLTFQTLKVDGDYITGEVSNQTKTFSFLDEVKIHGNADFSVSFDISGTRSIPTKTVNLYEGDNKFYILATVDGESKLYIVTIRRRPMYRVIFDTDGGTTVQSQSVEEGTLATSPSPSTKDGYTFTGWAYDFSKPITENTIITAQWSANSYSIKYDPDGDGVMNTLIVTYDQYYSLERPTRAGYTFEGWFNGTTKFSGGTWRLTHDTTLSPKWKTNSYKVTISANYPMAGDCTGVGSYAFGSTVTLTVPKTNLGYTWQGWFDAYGNKLSSSTSYKFTLGASNTEIQAKWKINDEMSDFEFTSTQTTCEITGVRDKTKTTYVIPKYVTSVAYKAFQNCNNMTSITIPDNVTSIGSGAFNGCGSLQSITLPFVGCSIKTATDTYQSPFGAIFGNTSYDGSIGIKQTYHGMSITYTTDTTYCIPASLESVTITGGNILYGAFSGCSNLTSIILPNDITSIGGYAFKDCARLTNINIPNSVAQIDGYAFQGCAALTNITIPNNVTNIGSYVFSNSCITSITIPNNVISIDNYAFYKCSTLTSITISDNVIHIGDAVFSGCSSLTNISLPNSLTSIGNSVFSGCHNLTNIILGDNITSIGEYAFRNCTNLKHITISKSVTSIGDNAFQYCKNLTSITLSNSLTSIGNSTFSNCTNLTDITFEGTIAQWKTVKTGHSWRSYILAKGVVCSDGMYYWP